MAISGKDDDRVLVMTPSSGHGDVAAHDLVNASGHTQELERNFSLISLAGVGLVVGNVWPAVGGSILVALYNGGSPGKGKLQFISSKQTLTIARRAL